MFVIGCVQSEKEAVLQRQQAGEARQVSFQDWSSETTRRLEELMQRISTTLQTVRHTRQSQLCPRTIGFIFDLFKMMKFAAQRYNRAVKALACLWLLSTRGCAVVNEWTVDYHESHVCRRTRQHSCQRPTHRYHPTAAM